MGGMAHPSSPRSPAAPARRKSFRVRRRVALIAVLAVVAALATLLWGRSEPVLGNPDARILLAWTSEDLLDDLARAARDADGVASVAEARNGVGWLTSWSAAGGEAEVPPDGYRVPVEILAVDPGDYAGFVPGEHREAFENLAQGGALLGATGASLRGISSEGTLGFSGTSVPVAAVVPDALVSNHEVVMSNDTASELGIDDIKYVVLERKRWTGPEKVEEQLRRALPEGARLQLRGPGDAAVFRPGGTILSQAEIKDLFGEFAARRGSGRAIQVDPGWILENTSDVTIPVLGRARCHNRIVPQMRGAFEEIADRGLDNLVRRNDFGGCFSPRFLDSDPHSGLSHHSWGIAFDFNVSRNPYGAEPEMDPRLVEVLERWGFTWGGHWVVPDGMHFEYLQEPGAAAP